MEHDPYTSLVPPQGIKLTPRHYAYLKISEGCNHRCSFCIIPDMRGDLVSRPIGDVMEEAERLVQAGVRELLVISQDTSAYGIDLKFRTGFWNGRPLKTRMQELCEALSEFGVWVRLHYVYPYPHVDRVVPLMAEGKILPYLDIPLQHGSPAVLQRMQRPAAAEKSLQRIAAWRDICPDITLRSTFIVGFPGETEDDFRDLLGFMEDVEFDRLGAFAFSPQDGTRAMAMELAPEIRVNALCPGVVETDMARAGFAIDGDEDEGIRRQHDAYPLRRIGTLEQAAAATLFLASAEAGFINGAALPMEGGATVGKW